MCYIWRTGLICPLISGAPPEDDKTKVLAVVFDLRKIDGTYEQGCLYCRSEAKLGNTYLRIVTHFCCWCNYTTAEAENEGYSAGVKYIRCDKVGGGGSGDAFFDGESSLADGGEGSDLMAKTTAERIDG